MADSGQHEQYKHTLDSLNLRGLRISNVDENEPPPRPRASTHQHHQQVVESYKESANKPKLPYNVKLPKVSGPSEAEKKMELLTREVEKELDEKEKQEYFGMNCKYICIKNGLCCKLCGLLF
jgi:hypothetical protein